MDKPFEIKKQAGIKIDTDDGAYIAMEFEPCYVAAKEALDKGDKAKALEILKTAGKKPLKA